VRSPSNPALQSPERRSTLGEVDDSFSEGLLGLLWQIVPSDSESNLRAHRECVESGARISAVGRADLFGDVAVQVIKHKTHVLIDIPIQTSRVDRLPSAGHAICGPQLIVQINGADAASNLLRAPTATP
jgi:hypothetical protein